MCSLVEHCFCFLAWRKRSCASSAALSNLITNQRRDKRSCCEPPLKTGIKVWESWWKSPQPFQQIPSARMHLFVSGLSNLCSPPLSFFFLFSSRAYLLWLQSLVCPLRGSAEVRTSWYSEMTLMRARLWSRPQKIKSRTTGDAWKRRAVSTTKESIPDDGPSIFAGKLNPPTNTEETGAWWLSLVTLKASLGNKTVEF